MFVTGGWIGGQFPPGKKDQHLGGIVLKNILEAHVQVYHALKSTNLGKSVQIGIVKDIFLFEPWNTVNPLDVFLAKSIDFSFNECILEFLRTGNYKYALPGVKPVVHTNPKAKTSNDFVGLNYYSHFHVQFNPKLDPLWHLRHQPLAIMTDMAHPVYPEGLYRSLKRMATLGVPIIVTENGIADADDSRRALYIKRYLYALSKAIKDGIPVKGYFYWSLMDNFEWAEGFDMRFGLYHNDFSTQKRTLRDGSKAYKNVVQKFSKKQ